MARGDTGPRSRGCREPTHELPRDGNNLPVQVKIDHLFRHRSLYGPEPELCNLVRGLNAYTFPQPMT